MSLLRRRPADLSSYAEGRRAVVFASLAALGLMALCSTASALDKPPLAPDTVAPFSTDSRILASVEFSLPALAAEIEKDIPKRLATINERVSCVHKRVLFARINANCDVYGYVERSGGVSLYGRGDRIYGSLPIYGALEGQGANRFTSHIRGESEASATVEAEARPELTPDWSIDLNFSDALRWNEPPVLHVAGREIPISKYAEPKVRAQLAVVRERAIAAVRKLDLHDKAAAAWRQAFEPVQLSATPEIWLQLIPSSVAFAGVRADGKVLRGSLQLSGSAETVVGQKPAPVTATALPPLGRDIGQVGQFDVILPVRIGYDVIKDKITQALAILAPAAGMSVNEVEVYPSSGKLVVGLRIAKASDTDATAGQWAYLTGGLQVDGDAHTIHLSDVNAATDDPALGPVVSTIVSMLGDKMSIDYASMQENALNAANAKLNRPLKDGFRMEGHLSSAKLEKVYRSADGVMLALRIGGDLKILYGM
jgi:hypothetical protein